MELNPDIYFITGDLGFGLFDKIRDDFPERFFNVGAAEQCMLDIGVGLALSGKVPIVYSITPFLLYRGFETLRTYINHEKIPVKLVGSGRGNDYEHDGFSHDATDDTQVFDMLTNITMYYPHHPKLEDFFQGFLNNAGPAYLNLARK